VPRIWFEKKQTTFARAWILDERDHAMLLSLLEHKVLTTQQIKSLYFRSLRRCQHRLKELRDLGLIASFTPRSGFGEGRPPDCLFLTNAGLIACAELKGIRASDLSWIPDEGYRSNRNLAHRLGVNGFFCGLVEASRAHEGHCLATWQPEHWIRTRAAEVKPDGFGRYLHPSGACEFYLEYDRGTEAVGALSRKLEGYLRLAARWTEEQDLSGFPNLLLIVPQGVRGSEQPHRPRMQPLELDRPRPVQAAGGLDGDHRPFGRGVDPQQPFEPADPLTRHR
jgi:Replication-relaxation